MSTIANIRPQLLSGARNVRSAGNISVWSSADTWLATLPLMFLVVRGTFSVFAVDTNVPGGGVYGSMLAGKADSGPSYLIQTAMVYAMICVVCLPWYKTIIATFFENKLLAILPLFSILTTAWSVVPSRSVSYGIMAFLNTAFAFYLAKRYTRTQQLELFLGLGIIALITSVLVVAVYPAAGFDHKGDVRYAVQGIFGHKNHCAMVMLLLLTPAFYLKLTTRLQYALRVVYVTTTMLLIIATTSRTGWLLLVITLFFIPTMGILRRMKQKDRFVIAFLLIAIVSVVSIFVYLEASNIALALGKDPTFSGRTDIWKAVLRPIFKRPLTGYGYYAFWSRQNPEALATAMSIGGTALGNAENGVLQMWLEMGGLGLLILFLILADLIRMSLTCFRLDNSDFNRWCMCMVFLGVIYGLIAGDKFMHPHTIEWTILALVYVNLKNSVRALI
jgi:exopolysaccharide production protein ExoQ